MSDDDLERIEWRRRALDLLARREHAPRELARKLSARGCPDPIVAAVLTGLERDGLLDTLRFAEAFIASRIGKGQGPLRIRGELEQRGVESAQCAAALEPHDWAALAARARAKRFGAAVPEDFTERARQGRFLEYRGFTREQIRHALEAVDHDRERLGGEKC